MKVIEAIKKERPTLSFEFYPPKTKEKEKHLFEVIAELKKFKPDYVSVTYGALGTTQGKTFYWAKEIKARCAIESVAHFTCLAASKESILKQLDELEGIGIENILALRGDPPEGSVNFIPPADGFKHADELVAFIKKNKPQMCLGVAGYPEKHPEAKSFAEDIKYLKQKVDAGADYIVSQLFFDNKHFFSFKDKCLKGGINVPIIPGIMPITNYKQIKKMTRICGARIPAELEAKLEKFADDKEKIIQIGVEQTVNQCKELLAKGVPGLHFFVMNQSGPISRILKSLES